VAYTVSPDYGGKNEDDDGWLLFADEAHQDLAANLRAERARAAMDQEELADAMRSLGFSSWKRQTVGQCEQARRRILAAEVFGLAMALQVKPGKLMGLPGLPGD
jgi:hypothetical protein